VEQYEKHIVTWLSSEPHVTRLILETEASPSGEKSSSARRLVPSSFIRSLQNETLRPAADRFAVLEDIDQLSEVGWQIEIGDQAEWID
jgi:hypothetical protein